MKIIDITIEIIEPLNILPNGKMDPTADKWMFGGTIYHIKTKKHTYSIQKENNIWYDPTWNYHNKSLKALLKQVETMYDSYEEYYKNNRTTATSR